MIWMPQILASLGDWFHGVRSTVASHLFPGFGTVECYCESVYECTACSWLQIMLEMTYYLTKRASVDLLFLPTYGSLKFHIGSSYKEGTHFQAEPVVTLSRGNRSIKFCSNVRD
ncbi:BA75_04339T0 [Komagataella pastoris]|uniref:BA75_04339T0 n=1 Tax=Komagataella pastoris TaxID=4922 RepID=A0A1B2JFF0_PICPA|nr:BA75_04339T0 [Komagataella pastoris]